MFDRHGLTVFADNGIPERLAHMPAEKADGCLGEVVTVGYVTAGGVPAMYVPNEIEIKPFNVLPTVCDQIFQGTDSDVLA